MNLLQATHFVREFLRGIFYYYCLSITAGFLRTVVKKHTYGVEGETNHKMFLVSFLFFLPVPTTNLCTKEEPSEPSQAKPRRLIIVPGKAQQHPPSCVIEMLNSRV
jgi:hypothetical protein